MYDTGARIQELIDSKTIDIYKSGINLIYIRNFFVHVDIQTTEIYAKYDSESKRRAIENAYPDLVQTNLPDWNKDSDLIKWLNTL